MKIPITLGVLTLGTAAVLVGNMNSDAIAARGSNFGGQGNNPNVIVGDVGPDLRNYGSSGNVAAYAVATTSCNIGNDYLSWEPNNNNHPVIGGAMYKVIEYDNGSSRIEHIGRSWLKHGFCALQQTLCGSCSNSGGGGCPSRLGWNCSDPYSASLNGQQSNLGPRFEVNPTTGYFEYPPSGGSYASTIGRRLMVHHDHLQDHSDPNVRYFVDATYIHPEDAAACNGNDNASYREVNPSSSYNISFVGNTVRTLPAIMAWEAVDQNVRITIVDVNDCQERFYYGVSVGDNGDGTWDYHYAFYNLNMHDAIGSVTIPHAGEAPSGINHFLAPYHSGDHGYTGGNTDDQIDWNETHDGDSLIFSTEDFAVNEDAHAIHWQAMGTFSFTSIYPPTTVDVEVGFHKSGDSMTLQMTGPDGNSEPPSECELSGADIDLDGDVDGADMSQVLGFWGTDGNNGSNNARPDVNNDGNVDGVDLSIVLGYWGCSYK